MGTLAATVFVASTDAAGSPFSLRSPPCAPHDVDSTIFLCEVLWIQSLVTFAAAFYCPNDAVTRMQMRRHERMGRMTGVLRSKRARPGPLVGRRACGSARRRLRPTPHAPRVCR